MDQLNRDKTRLMEKPGAIQPADDFGTSAVLRNKYSHHYPEEASLRIERLNLVMAEAECVVSIIDDIMASSSVTDS